MSERDFTTGELETIFHKALEAGDVRGVHAALSVLAVRDPKKAQRLFDTLETALALAVQMDEVNAKTRAAFDEWDPAAEVTR